MPENYFMEINEMAKFFARCAKAMMRDYETDEREHLLIRFKEHLDKGEE